MSDARIAVSLRGLPEWLIRDYLEELGARAEGEPDAPRMRAEGWTVEWSSQSMAVAGSRALSLTQFDLIFEGEAATVEDVSTRFLAKAQRGGG